MKVTTDKAVDQPAGFLRKYWFVTIASVLIVSILVILAYQFWWGATRLPFIKHIDNFTLENLDGKQVQFNELDGKVRLVSFIYTKCPDVCPATSEIMEKVQEELKKKGIFGSETAFVSITFDPQTDTPEVLQRYAKAFHADLTGWYFLRGDEPTIAQVTNLFGVGVEKQPNGQYIHTMRTFLVDKDKNIRKMYGMGAGMDINEIITDMEQLAKE